MHPQRNIGESWSVNMCHSQGRGVLLVAVLGALTMSVAFSHAQNTATERDSNKIRLHQIEGGVVSVLKKGAGAGGWVPTREAMDLEPGDRVQTGRHTRAALLWSDQTVVPIDELTELEILPPRDVKDQFGLNLIKGIISFFHRSSEPSRIRVITRAAMAGIVGTEFVL